VAVWNDGGPGSSETVSVTSLRVLASTQSDFSGSTDLGTFSLAVLSTNIAPATVLTFGATDARYIRLQILANNGSSITGMREVAFREAPSAVVPEPSTLALAGVGVGVVLVGMIRRRRA